MSPSDFSPGIGMWTSRFGLIPLLSRPVTRDPMRSPLFHRWLSPHSAPHTPEGSSRLHLQTLRLFHGLRAIRHARHPLAPLAGLTCRRCRIPFMVRTTGLRSLLGSILRFTTASHPAAVAGSYGALWQLLRPDFHRLVICGFQGTPNRWLAVFHSQVTALRHLQLPTRIAEMAFEAL